MSLEVGSLKTVKIPLQELQNQLIDLNKQSYVVWPNFLVDADLLELKNDLEGRFDAGSMVRHSPILLHLSLSFSLSDICTLTLLSSSSSR